MSNIFDFPPDRRDRGTPPGFLNDSVDLVQFDDLGRTHWPSADPDGALPRNGERARDWSNQELASIYRVRSLLEAAGVSTVVDRGLSDEGDPWCVFCRTDGEVFIHLCRIDGRYILDSPNLERPLKGASFANLIESFSGGAVSPRDEPPAPRGRVVRLDPEGNVFLHPVTMLAALVWTVLLRSEDLVLVQVDAADGAANAEWLAGLGEPGTESDEFDAAAFEDPGAREDAYANALAGFDGEARALPAEGAGFQRESAAKLILTSPLTGVAAGLSTIAIACGFMSEAVLDEAGFLSISLFEDGAGEAGGAAEADADAAHTTDEGGAPEGLAALIQTILHTPDAKESAAPAPGGGEAAGASQVPTLADLLGVPLDDLDMRAIAESEGQPDQQALEGTAAELQMAQAGARLPALEGAATTSPADAGPLARVSELVSIEDIKNILQRELLSFDFGGVALEASFDVDDVAKEDSEVLNAALRVVQAADEGAASGRSGAEEDSVLAAHAKSVDGTEMAVATALSAEDEIAFTPPSPPGPAQAQFAPDAAEIKPKSHQFTQRPEGNLSEFDLSGFSRPPRVDEDLPLFDDKATEFFFYLSGKSRDVEYMAGDDVIFVIDFGVEGPARAMMWELSHGGTIVTVGAVEDYQEFGLLA